MSDTKELAAAVKKEGDRLAIVAEADGATVCRMIGLPLPLNVIVRNAVWAIRLANRALALRESADLLEQQAETIRKLREGLKDFLWSEPNAHRRAQALLAETDHP